MLNNSRNFLRSHWSWYIVRNPSSSDIDSERLSASRTRTFWKVIELIKRQHWSIKWATIKSYQTAASWHQKINWEKIFQSRNDYQGNLLSFLIFILKEKLRLSYETALQAAYKKWPAPRANRWRYSSIYFKYLWKHLFWEW